MATDLKNQIAQTFEKYARRSGLDKVTINAIVTECGISRQAFYYYFQDIVDVARYIIKKRLEQTQRAAEEAGNPQQAVKVFAEEMTGQFSVISIALNSKLRSEMELLMIRELKDYFYTVFSRQDCGRDLTRQQIDFHSDLIACGITAYCIEHCNDSSFDANAFSQQLSFILMRTYG